MKKYDTEDDWTFGFNDNELKDISEDEISFSQTMTEHLIKHGFTIYDTSSEREQIFNEIVDDVKSKILI